MATLSELTALRDSLVKARATGVLSVRNGDHQVTYKTDAEMKDALDYLERQISAAISTKTMQPFRVAYDKGN